MSIKEQQIKKTNDIFLSTNEWNKLISEKKITALPKQSGGFLMIGQRLDVLVKYENKKYHASAWTNSDTITLSKI